MNYQAERFILQNKGNFCTVLEDVHNIFWLFRKPALLILTYMLTIPQVLITVSNASVLFLLKVYIYLCVYVDACHLHACSESTRPSGAGIRGGVTWKPNRGPLEGLWLLLSAELSPQRPHPFPYVPEVIVWHLGSWAFSRRKCSGKFSLQLLEAAM